MKTSIFVIAIALSVASAAEKPSVNGTADASKTKDSRGKRNLNSFGSYGASRRNDGYNYQPSGYNYEPSNYIGGGSAGNENNFQPYPEPPEPIIEIIIQDNNETLPPPEPIVQSNGKKKKEQVQVFYVKYHKDEKSGLVIHDPIPALTPNGHQQEDEYEDEPLQIVTPIPNVPQRSTTLRTIIRPDSQQYESDSGVHVTFGSPHNHHSKSDNRIHDEEKVESAIRPVVQPLPQNRVGVFGSNKEKRTPQAGPQQGRVVNQGPPPNFQPQPAQQPPFQRPPPDFNPQSNFIQQPNQGHLSHQLSLPSQDPSKPFHPNVQHHQQGPPQRPQPIPIHHQPQNQFGQNVLGHQQFNQPPRLPNPAPLIQQQQQQQPIFRPPQRPAVPANFNQNQRPFNYHAHPTPQQSAQQPQQVRFPNQPPPQQQQHFQGPPQTNFQGPPQTNFQGPPQQNFQPNFQQPQHLQRPQAQQLPPRQSPPQNFHQGPQLPQIQRPGPQFSGRPLQSQPQFPPNQAAPPNFRPNPEPVHHHSQPLHQHNLQAQNFEHEQNNVFRGGLVQQVAPDLTNGQHRPQFPPHQHQQQAFREDQQFRQENLNFIQNSFGSNVQVSSSVPKFEHHIVETVNPPVVFHPTAVDMDRLAAENNRLQQEQNLGPVNVNLGPLQSPPQPRPVESQHRFAVNQQSHQQSHHQEAPRQQEAQHQQVHHQVQQQSHQLGGVSNHYSEVFPQGQPQFTQQNFVELNGRNNFSPEPRAPEPRPTTAAPATTRKAVTTTEKPAPSSTSVPKAAFDLPDEVPDDLRAQLLSSGILDNAQISILDYDKIGETSLQDLPPEHLANFFNAGGGAQIGASNKVISVVKSNGDSIDERIKSLKNDREVTKVLESAKKPPSKKEDVNLKVVRFDAQSQKNLPSQYIQSDSKILPTVNLEQNNFNRYLPLKINGAQFPIPDVEELRGKQIASVVVLAPVNGNEEESRSVESKQIKFAAGDSLKNLLRKPSTDNFKKWLEKEQKTNPELQSVVLLVTKDNATGEQEIFMYDIITKTVSRLSGELSSKFVDVAEENFFDESSESIDRVGESNESSDSSAEPSGIVETVVAPDSSAEASSIVESVVALEEKPLKPVAKEEQPENKIDISSGYSAVKNE